MLTEDDFARAIRLAWRASPHNDQGLSVAPLSPLTLDFLARGAFGLHSDEINGLREQVRAELIAEAKAIAKMDAVRVETGRSVLIVACELSNRARRVMLGRYYARENERRTLGEVADLGWSGICALQNCGKTTQCEIALCMVRHNVEVPEMPMAIKRWAIECDAP